MAVNIKTQSLLDTILNASTIPNGHTVTPLNKPYTLLSYKDGSGTGTPYLVSASATDIVDIAFSLNGTNYKQDSKSLYKPRLSYSVGVSTSDALYYNRLEEMSKRADRYPVLTGVIQATTLDPIRSGTAIQSRVKDTIVHQTLFQGGAIYTRSVNPSETSSIWETSSNPTRWDMYYFSKVEPSQQQKDSNRINGSAPFYYASMNGWTTLCQLDTTSTNSVIVGALGIQNRDGTTISNNGSINDILDVCKDKGLPIRNRETGGFMKVSSNGVDGYIISELCMRPKTLTLTSIKVGTPVSYVMTLNGATSKNFVLKEIPQYYDLAYMNSKLTHTSLIAKYATVNLCGLGSTYLSGGHTIDDIITKMGWTIDGQNLSDIYTSSGKETALYYLYSMFYSCAANRYRLYDTYSNSDIRVISINDTQTSYDAIMLRCDTGKLTYVGTSSSTPKHSYIWPMTAFATFSFYFDSSGSMNAYIFPEGTWTTVIPG